MSAISDGLAQDSVEKYDPNQPRNPKGAAGGGRWKGKTGSAGPADAPAAIPEYFPDRPWRAISSAVDRFDYELGVKEEQVSSNSSRSYVETLKGEATISIRTHSLDRIELHWLLAEKRGAGRAALERITQLADRHGVKIGLWAQPLPGQGENEGMLLSKPRLEAFYQGFGFKVKRKEGGTAWMEREPSDAVEKYDPQQPRNPKGSPGGGQWVGGIRGAAAGKGKNSLDWNEQQAPKLLGAEIKAVSGQVVKSLHPSLQKAVKAVPVKLVQRVMHEGRMHSNLGGAYTAKAATPGQGTIQIASSTMLEHGYPLRVKAPTVGRDMLADFSVAGTIRHEMGHAVYHNLPRGYQGEWNKVAKLGKGKVSRYADSSTQEMFAEAFSVIAHPSYARGSLPSTMEAWFDSRVMSPKVRKSLAQEIDVERIAQIADAIDDGESLGTFSRESAADMRAELAKRAPEHSGIFVAFPLAPDAARALAVEGGEKAEELHVTLAYGDGNLARALAAVEALAPSLQPLSGLVRETDSFEPTEQSDGEPVQYAVPSVPGLRDTQAEVMSALRANGFTERTPREYTPHITLRYGSEPVAVSAPVSVRFDRIIVSRSGLRVTIPLGLEKRSKDGAPQARWPAGHPWAPTGDGPGRFRPKAEASYGSRAADVQRHTGPPTIVVSLTPTRERATDKKMKPSDDITKESGGKLGEAIVIEALRSHLAKREYVAEVTSTLEDIGHKAETHERAIPAPKDAAVAKEVRSWKEWDDVQALAQRKKTANVDSARNNAPVDVIAGDELIEVKAGPWSNTEASQRWRVSEGAIGKAETALRNRMSKKIASLDTQYKAAAAAHGKDSSKALNLKIKMNTWKAEKSARGALSIVRAMERKKRFVEQMSKVSGRKMKYRAINVIFNHTTGVADLFATSYASKEIRWSQRGDLQHLGSFKYKVQGRYKVRGGEFKEFNLRGDSEIAKYLHPPMPDDVEIDDGGDDPYTEQLVADLSDGTATYDDLMPYEDADALRAEDDAIFAEDAKLAEALWGAIKGRDA